MKVPTARQYVVGILASDPDKLRLHAMRSGTALKYPIHVSIKGRFIAHRNVGQNDLARSLAVLSQSVKPFTAEVFGPTKVNDQLYWMECQPSSPGYTSFRCLHSLCEGLLEDKVLQECTPPEFRFEGYRPHVTLAWYSRSDPDRKQADCNLEKIKPFVETVKFQRLCLFSYDEDPHTSLIEAVELE
jgi:hypothetical protein